MRVGRVASTELVINNWFIVILVFFAGVGMAAQAALTLVSVLAHELAHVAVALASGYRVLSVEALPFGGRAVIEARSSGSGAAMVKIALAGPLTSLLIAVLLHIYMEPGINSMYTLLYQVNLMLGLFNLLPAFPLDGGRIAAALLTRFGTERNAVFAVSMTSAATAVMLLCWFVYDITQSGFINVSLLLAAAFIVWQARLEWRKVIYSTLRNAVSKKTRLLRQGCMESKWCAVDASMYVKDALRNTDSDRYLLVAVLDDGRRVRALLGEAELWEMLIANGSTMRFYDIDSVAARHFFN